jgi:hypothetical protein
MLSLSLSLSLTHTHTHMHTQAYITRFLFYTRNTHFKQRSQEIRRCWALTFFPDLTNISRTQRTFRISHYESIRIAAHGVEGNKWQFIHTFELYKSWPSILWLLWIPQNLSPLWWITWLEGEMLSPLRISGSYISTCSEMCHSFTRSCSFSPAQNVTRRKVIHSSLSTPNTFVKKTTQSQLWRKYSLIKKHGSKMILIERLYTSIFCLCKRQTWYTGE